MQTLVRFGSGLLPFLLAAACGGTPPGTTSDAADRTDAGDATDDGAPQDGMAPDLSCVGSPLPTTAPDPILVSGTTANPLGGTRIGAVLVDAVDRSSGTVAASATSAGDGTFSFMLPTGAVPWDGYLRATEGTHLTTYIYPPAPLAADVTGVTLPILDSSQRNLVYSLAGSNPMPVAVDSAASTAIVSVADCSSQAVAGAVVSFTPPAARVLYMQGGFPNGAAMSTDTSGLAIGLNVPADALGRNVSTSADWFGAPLGTTAFGSWSDAIVVTFVRP